MCFILQSDPEVKMLVLLGEVGGKEEYIVCDLLKSKKIRKPLVAWCIGTCQDRFTTDVQVRLQLLSMLFLYWEYPCSNCLNH